MGGRLFCFARSENADGRGSKEPEEALLSPLFTFSIRAAPLPLFDHEGLKGFNCVHNWCRVHVRIYLGPTFALIRVAAPRMAVTATATLPHTVEQRSAYLHIQVHRTACSSLLLSFSSALKDTGISCACLYLCSSVRTKQGIDWMAGMAVILAGLMDQKG